MPADPRAPSMSHADGPREDTVPADPRAPSVSPTPYDLWAAALRCYEQRDIDGFASLFAPDGVMEIPFAVPGIPDRLAGRDEIHRTLGPVWRAAQTGGHRVLRHETIAAHTTGDPGTVVVEFAVFGEDAAGAGYRLAYVHVIHVRDGRIALLRDYVDARAIAERRAAAART